MTNTAHRVGDALTPTAYAIALVGVLIFIHGRFEIAALLVGSAAVLLAVAAYLLGRPDRPRRRCSPRGRGTCLLLAGHEGSHLP